MLRTVAPRHGSFYKRKKIELRHLRCSNNLAGNMSLFSLNVSPEVIQSAWFKTHLSSLGLDNIKLYAYQKLGSFSIAYGGGFLKQTVEQLTTYAKKDWVNKDDLVHHVQSDLEQYNFFTSSSDPKLFYMAVGLISFIEHGNGNRVQALTNELVDSYLKLGGAHLGLTPPSATEKRILKVASEYYKSVKINYRNLYDPLLNLRWVQIGDGAGITVPPLPQVKSKHLLARALLHKELYLALSDPNHLVHAALVARGIPVNADTLRVIRHDLLFLDGLGDYLIATEASAFLYKFRLLKPFSDDETFGRKTYHSLRRILGTNTLLSRLALVYNLHNALEDPVVNRTLFESYIPNLCAGNHQERTDEIVYEEEFAADYFEQYVGALYLENPVAAKAWLNDLFERILYLISDEYRVLLGKKSRRYRYDYKAWSVDVIGRSV
ncbi:hypothetical protein PUMCH_000951 [Australozyma saopauloensis]|uniref:RNase III domain-containing protein n=1 Tax=Australozyma saopauloensis TaxID=291208 RepID=A0AAX4H634_9ASCO|nr:hypothetical protein PUMCH_000951 [[Candida] saopauloensis]